jgi:amino acid transporter
MSNDLIKQKTKERFKRQKKADFRYASVMFVFMGIYFIVFMFLDRFPLDAAGIVRWLITAILVGFGHHIVNYEVYSRLHEKELEDEDFYKALEEEIKNVK